MKMFFKNRPGHICSWRSQWTLNNPIRLLLHPPDTILAPFVKPGMTVIDTGCGTGAFTIPMAHMVGETGKVLAVELQAEALARIEEKAERTGLTRRIETWKCEAEDIGPLPSADFALSFYMAHEVPDIQVYFTRMAECVKPGGLLLLAEPPIHVSQKAFKREVHTALDVGFALETAPPIRFSHAAMLKRT
ncbi:SAM-dependent methyltransferase [Pseudodesulfovibrio sediminis]|uniref:Arsenite methyltransferase n=1 Tax=Pseudodesulfovibrio sediminis TaxID=2810563 RepID=A0ABN6ESV1_9BACT|nr:class I SAM-dependent methyltransferase [Pseudodesulfovibrio sediminis]BCS88545.1 type 11 methyltransferase [Pseudodesulfovibrio sediminis]